MATVHGQLIDSGLRRTDEQGRDCFVCPSLDNRPDFLLVPGPVKKLNSNERHSRDKGIPGLDHGTVVMGQAMELQEMSPFLTS